MKYCIDWSLIQNKIGANDSKATAEKILFHCAECVNLTLLEGWPKNMMMYAPFLLLVVSNSFMTLAWYGHLKFLHNAPIWQAVLISWSIAFFEYLFMVPANRLFSEQNFSLGQMKILQEVITLLVFTPFMLFLFKQPFKMDYVWAAVCLLGAVYFVFRNQLSV